MRLTADILKIQPEQRRWWGWAYVAEKADGTQVVDVSGDVVDTPEARQALEDAFYRYVKDSGSGDDAHEFFGAAKLIEALAMTPEKAHLMGLNESVPTGLWVGFEAAQTPEGEILWNRVKSGEYRMMSIVGTVAA